MTLSSRHQAELDLKIGHFAARLRPALSPTLRPSRTAILVLPRRLLYFPTRSSRSIKSSAVRGYLESRGAFLGQAPRRCGSFAQASESILLNLVEGARL